MRLVVIKRTTSALLGWHYAWSNLQPSLYARGRKSNDSKQALSLY
jgi:hypothetical protein